MRFVAGTADFPVICHVSDARDITRNRRETILRYKQFGKSIVKYNAFKQNFTLFCSTSEPKGVSFTLWIFRWRIFDRHDVLYALGNDKVENDQPPEAANVLYWFEKVPYLLCWKLGRTLHFFMARFGYTVVTQNGWKMNLSLIILSSILYVSYCGVFPYYFRPSRIPKSSYQNPGMQGLVKVQV